MCGSHGSGKSLLTAPSMLTEAVWPNHPTAGIGVLLVSPALIATVCSCATRPSAPPVGSPQDALRNDLGALHRAAGIPRRDARSSCRPQGREYRVAPRDSARSLTHSSGAASRTSSHRWLRVLPGTFGTRSPRSGATHLGEDHPTRTSTILSSETCGSGSVSPGGQSSTCPCHNPSAPT